MGHAILQQILTEAKNAQLKRRPFLTVFDLDSTLFDLHFRVARIVDDFAEDGAHQRRFPKECEALSKIQILRTDWGIGEALARIGLRESESPEFWQALHEHWSERFFGGDYLHHDEPLPGAVEYVRELLQLGADIMYLTGRDVPRMLKGTISSLESRGFPVAEPGVRVVLKPSEELNDAQFKLDVLRAEETKYDKIWLFENEPVNLNLIGRKLPSVALVFIDSVHCGREEVSLTLDRIHHFEVDLEEFRH